MTQKNKTILVGVLALGVWVYAGKEWLGYLGTDIQKDSTTISSSSTVPSKLFLLKESYFATYDYKDPFLGSSSYSYPTNQNTSVITNVDQTSKTNIAQPPIIHETIDIKYQGLISNEKGVFGLLTIDGKSHVVSKGDEVNKIKVINISTKELVLEVAGEIHTVSK